MTLATREALEQVAGILRDAGWDAAPPPVEPGRLTRRLEEVRAELGLDPQTFRRAVLEAVAGER